MRVQSANRAAALKREQSQPQAKPVVQAPTAPLPKSDYWTTMPTPSKPSTLPVTQKEHVAAGATVIPVPEGYTVQNIQPTTVEQEFVGPLQLGVERPIIKQEAVSYEMVKKPEPVKQSDIGIGEQMFVAVDTGIKVMKQLAGDNPVVKAEIEHGLAPIGYVGAGATGALESSVYGSASLVGSAVKSVQEKKLTYAPGFEGIVPSWKTPKLAPTPSGSTVSLLVGGGEAQEMAGRPWAYQLGSAFGEAAFTVATGEALGVAGSKTSTFVKTVVNPRVNQAAESALARSQRLFEAAANRVQPGLGRATETVISRDAAALGTKLDLLEAKAGVALTSKVVNPAKYGVINPVVDVAVKAKRGVATVGQRIVDVRLGGEAGSVAKSVVVPNLKQPQKLLAPTVKLASERSGVVSKASGFVDDLAKDVSGAWKGSTVKQALMYEKSVGIPSARNVLANYATPLTKSNVGIKPVMSEAAAYAKVSAGRDLFKAEKALHSVNAQIRNVKLAPESVAKTALNQLSYQKTVLQTQMRASYDVLVKPNVEVGKALGKVATGTLRYSFGIAAPKQPIVKTPLKFAPPKIETKQVMAQVQKQEAAKTKEVTFTSGMPKATSPYPGTRQRFHEELELVPLSYPPKEGVKPSEQRLVPIVTPIPDVKIVPDQKIKPIVPNVKPTVDTRILPDFKPKVDTRISPVVTPRFAQELLPTVLQKTIQTVKLAPSFPSRGRGKAQFPSLGLGGGGGGGGGFDALTGKWRKFKNPIKTPKQMLESFSSFGSGKRVKSVKLGRKDLALAPVSINTKIFKQPRKYNNTIKQRRRKKC